MFTSLVVMDPEGMQYYLVKFAFLLIKSGLDLLALYLCPDLLGAGAPILIFCLSMFYSRHKLNS